MTCGHTLGRSAAGRPVIVTALAVAGVLVVLIPRSRSPSSPRRWSRQSIPSKQVSVSGAGMPRNCYLALRLGLLETERSALRDWRSHGYITATVLRAIERSLDLEEARIRGS